MMNKKLLTLAIGSVLSFAAGSALAALPQKAQLTIDAGGSKVVGCVFDTPIDPATGECPNPAGNVTGQIGSFFELGGGVTNLGMLDPANLQLGGVQLTRLQNSSGSHAGAPNGSESPLIDKPWEFSSNTGMHGSIQPVIISTAGGGEGDGTGDGIAHLDFRGWNVTWNNIPAIAMGACQFGDRANNGGFSGCDTDQDNVDDLLGNTGVAVVKCFTTAALRDDSAAATAADPPTTPPAPDGECLVGNFYLLDHFANVPAGDPSGFGGAGYTLHLEGTIVDTNQAPVATANPLPLAMSVSTSLSIDLAANATDPDGDGLNASSCIVTYTGTRLPEPTITPAPGVAGSCSITYLDNDGSPTTAVGNEDTFDYTIADTLGKVSDPITAQITLAVGNVPPTANPFNVTTNLDTSLSIDIPPNATDSDGTIDVSSVVISTPPVVGMLNAPDSSGLVTYTPGVGLTGSDTFSYTINDNEGATSAPAVVTIKVNSPPVLTLPATPTDIDRNTDLVIQVPNIATDADGGIVGASTITTNGSNGGTTEVSLNDSNVSIITYTPPSPTYIGPDDFEITVTDTDGSTETATYNLIVNNIAPVAFSDDISLNTTTDSSVNINVLSNDRDIDGTIDAVTIVTQPAVGTAVVTFGCVFQDNNQQDLPPVTCITYSVSAGSPGVYSLEYTVTDNNGATSGTTGVDISVSDGGETVLDSNAYLFINTGNVEGKNIKPAVGQGSWFSMQLEAVPNPPVYTSMTGFDNLRLSDLGVIQPGTSADPGVDVPWEFAGPTGVHKTDEPITIFNNTVIGTAILQFRGWAVFWNGIPFTLGFGPDNGLATMICANDCSPGDTYVLDYSAQVPDDAKAFNGIQYKLHLEGIISLIPAKVGGLDPSAPFDITDISVKNVAGDAMVITPGSAASAVGNTTGIGLTSGQVIKDPLLNPGDGKQCIGGCLDFVASGLTPGDYIELVVYLNVQLPSGAILRKSINGKWSNFDTSQGDLFGSADAVTVGNTGMCQQPEGTFNVGLREGARCVFMRITDGGPNDADGVANGVIVDPSGALLSGAPNVPASGSNSSGGCSISSTPVTITERSDWLLVVAFLAIVALRRRKSIER